MFFYFNFFYVLFVFLSSIFRHYYFLINLIAISGERMSYFFKVLKETNLIFPIQKSLRFYILLSCIDSNFQFTNKMFLFIIIKKMRERLLLLSLALYFLFYLFIIFALTLGLYFQVKILRNFLLGILFLVFDSKINPQLIYQLLKKISILIKELKI